MNLTMSPDDQMYRAKFLNWLKENIPTEVAWAEEDISEDWQTQAEIFRKFQRKLFDAGYAGIHWPKEYGGQSGTLMQHIIVTEELSANYPWKMFDSLSVGLVAPTLLSRGTEEQKKEFIPKILSGEHIWCQGFSEPNAGSDLANLSTSAVRMGDRYIVNGQKVWTSIGHLADYCILVVRTDPKASKHKGLSYLLVYMKSPGVTVRPIKQITGEAEYNELFFDNVEVPLDRLVGKENEGWLIAITTLMFERIMNEVSILPKLQKSLDRLIDLANNTIRDGQVIIKNPVYRQKIALLQVDVEVMRLNQYRNLATLLKGEMPGPEGSIGKVFWSELNQRMQETALEIMGPYSQLLKGSKYAKDNGKWTFDFLRARGNTIEGGTTEIQKNIIGERVLGLPKDAVRRK
ncbi:MAG TPA: acyl-CoA dehydrogenase [Desulfosporosinus sp.]|nr:acyl-CoA dehydrogenase [Desulfosporosinus sp.]